nr:uncharacterized protein [Tanacetum cinerariifolium]
MAPPLEWCAVRFIVSFSMALAVMYDARENGTTTEVVQSDIFVIKDLENIKAIVDRMEIKMDGMLKSADFVIGEGVEEAVMIGVDEMKNPVKEFARMMDDLNDQSVKSISNIKRATTMILEELNEHPRITG